jgi:two-component system cell cycle sensor histidine kinase/response regulator CckA
LQKRMLLATIFLTMLACGLTWWILKRQLAPIFTTIKTLATLSDTDRPPQPLPITRQDEIGELIVSFNHLLETLEQRGKALRASEEQYRILFEGINDAVFVHDMDEEGLPCRFLQVNDVACRRLGYTKEELLALTPQDITSPEEYERIADKRISLTSQRDILVETVHVTKDGRKIPVESNICKFQYYDRQVVLSISRDITERKQTEVILQEQLLFLQQLLDAIPIPIFYKDRQGIFRGCNTAYEKFVGMAKERIVGKILSEVFPQNLANIYNQADLALFARPGVQVYETLFLHADGIKRDIIFSKATYFDAEGDVAGLVGVILDVTERKRAEEEKQSLQERLQRAEKMEALGQLAGGVAHDLNNVLGVSTIYSELLQEKIPEESPLRKYVDNIFASTQKGAAIIEDLLTLARRGVAASEVINLNSIVSNFLKGPVFEKIQAFHPNVTFRTECRDDLLNIKGSPVHLEKTLMNLVSNAAEAISGRGDVTIRIENRYLDMPVRGYDEVKQGDYVVLTVSDTGMGIPAENREKIFEPFYTKKTMGRSGTGLGLAIVWGTVKDHSGYIDLQTEVGEGATFTLYFPVTRQELLAQPQKMPIAQYMGRGESVLIVDDIAEQRDIASRLLARLGYAVNAVSSGEGAVEYLKEHTADILVLDMIMTPGIDGLETYRRALEINPRQKAILVSGFSETDRVKEAQKLGAGAYVKKPYVTEKIGLAIRDELDRS